MNLFVRSLFYSSRDRDWAGAVTERIAVSPLLLEPFPHIIVDDVLPAELHREMLARWPAREEMIPESDGSLDRYLFNVVSLNSVAVHGMREITFWKGFANNGFKALVAQALEHFRPFNEKRFGVPIDYYNNGMCFEAGSDFTQNTSHTHHAFGPGWLMSFLLYLDDGGRTDRGSELCAPVRGTDWLDIVSSSPQLQLRPMKTIPFRANRLVAWLDGPMSFHGTALLKGSNDRRRIFRGHIQAKEAVVERSLGMSSEAFCEVCQKHLAGDSASLREVLARPGNPIEALPRFSFA